MKIIYLFLFSWLLTACLAVQCDELTAYYELKLDMAPHADTLKVGDIIRFSYSGDAIRNNLNGKIVNEIDPAFGVTVYVNKIDSNARYPQLVAAATDFSYTDGITGTFQGSGYTAFNMRILKREGGGFAGELLVQLNQTGFYLFQLTGSDRVVYSAEKKHKCDKEEQFVSRFSTTSDVHELTYNRIFKAQAFEPGKNKLIWVK